MAYGQALAAVEELRGLIHERMTMTQLALRWTLMFAAVTCAIPGGKRAGQVRENCAASEMAALSAEAMGGVERIYQERIYGGVHHRW